MSNLKERNQDKLNWAKEKGIQTEELVKKHGIRFVVNLLKDLTSGERNTGEWTNFRCPNFGSNSKLAQKKYQQYLEMLRQAGFKFVERPEDFIDEDTGEVVTIPRLYIYYIK